MWWASIMWIYLLYSVLANANGIGVRLFSTLRIALGYSTVPYWASVRPGLGRLESLRPAKACMNRSTHVGYWVNFTAEVLIWRYSAGVELWTADRKWVSCWCYFNDYPTLAWVRSGATPPCLTCVALSRRWRQRRGCGLVTSNAVILLRIYGRLFLR